MLNETFVCTEELFPKDNESLPFPAALYESENFIVSIGYMGDYAKDKEQNTFRASSINFTLKPKASNTYPPIGFTGLTDPYDDKGLIIAKNFGGQLPEITPANYEEAYQIYRDMIELAKRCRDTILSKYFPKEATYIER